LTGSTATTGGRVAVLGAGIMGSSVALHLARLGVPVTVFDREDAPFRGASRWNEGKIHVGFLYSGDPTLRTARAVLDGGLDFTDQVEDLTGASIRHAFTSADDVYLLHRDSVVAPDAAGPYFEAVAELVRAHPDAGRYPVDLSQARVERLSAGELAELADPALVAAGYRVPERSVDTNVVADAFVRALDAEDLVELAPGLSVTGASPAGGDPTGPWRVHAGGESHGPFTAVVNALWSGRPAVDHSAGHRPDTGEQHRYRAALFVRTRREVQAASAVVAVGPFGDVKRYGPLSFYLSWYPAGLLARSESVEPPPTPRTTESDRRRIAAATFTQLAAVLPAVAEVERAAAEVRVEGGWVYSQGRGTLDDPAAEVHRRDRLGISRLGSYISVDTGKYSVAPTLAERVARTLVGR
jgi:glycine/D-amino acid oxidase-like deaminating enzyme